MGRKRGGKPQAGAELISAEKEPTDEQKRLIFAPYNYEAIPESLYSVIQAIVGFGVVLPIRGLLMIGFQLFYWFTLLFIWWPGFGFENDLQKAGMRRRRISRAWTRMVIPIYMFIVGIYTKVVKGTVPPLPKDHCLVIVSNHCSFFDILTLKSVFDSGFVSKTAVRDTFSFGVNFFSKVWECLYVSRESSESREKARNDLIERHGDASAAPLVVFPEGTTNSGRGLIKFKTGAFLAGLPVLPVAIKYRARHFLPTWSDNGAVYTVCRALSQFVSLAEVSILPMYYPSELEKKDPELFAENVRKLIAAELNVPATTLRHRDAFLWRKYRQGLLPWKDFWTKLMEDNPTPPKQHYD